MYCTFVSSLNATASVNVRWTCSGPQTWLRCSIELVSRPVFSSSGKVLFSKVLWCLMFGGLWIWTCAATSIFPFRPNLGDHMFSSISVSSATVATLVEVRSLLEPLPLLELEPYRQNRRPTCQLTAQTDTSAQLWLFDMKTNSRFQTNGFWVLADEVFFSPLFQGRQIMIKFLLHFLLTHTQTVPEDQTNIFYSLFWIFFLESLNCSLWNISFTSITYMSPMYWGLHSASSASLDKVCIEKSFATAALWNTLWTIVPFSICFEPPSKVCITGNRTKRKGNLVEVDIMMLTDGVFFLLKWENLHFFSDLGKKGVVTWNLNFTRASKVK